MPRPGREQRIVVCLSLLLAAPLAAQDMHFEGGASLARGDYVYTQQTSGAAFSAGLAWSTRRLTLRASWPYFVRDTRLLTPQGGPSSAGSTLPPAPGGPRRVLPDLGLAFIRRLRLGGSG